MLNDLDFHVLFEDNIFGQIQLESIFITLNLMLGYVANNSPQIMFTILQRCKLANNAYPKHVCIIYF